MRNRDGSANLPVRACRHLYHRTGRNKLQVSNSLVAGKEALDPIHVKMPAHLLREIQSRGGSLNQSLCRLKIFGELGDSSTVATPVPWGHSGRNARSIAIATNLRRCLTIRRRRSD